MTTDDTSPDPLAATVRDAVADAVDMSFWGVVDLAILTDRLRPALDAERARPLDVERLALAIERSGFAFDSPDAAYAIAREYIAIDEECEHGMPLETMCDYCNPPHLLGY
jgi:hypothetical protein